ncbi:MAG: MBOAT family protein [Acidimicrobiia bacterium]|nr:MBOAT family protein [Acidimicrobiia bacterium]
MIFHSLDFIAFFAIMLIAYWRLPLRAQNVLLLVGSYLFYGWVHPWWPVLLCVTTLVDYWAARRIFELAPARRSPILAPRAPTPDPRRKAWLWSSLAANLGLLGFYKYFDFFVANVAAAGAALGWHMSPLVLGLALPAGISFYTFQSMSYTIDVYRGHAPARTNFIDVAAFVSFFPHLVAGPIMRATNLLPQVEQERRFDVAAVRGATVLIVWGFFKKLVIADNVGVIANKVFALQQPDFYVLWAGVFAFAIQIYADFSAYTDIARGVAKCYGFDLIKNFERPYLAAGPADFWHRWNISLSTWFRDYVYIPLGGSRRGPWRVGANLMMTFLASGIWHGASWNYVLWGAYHGLLLVLARGFSAVRMPAMLRPLRMLAMFALTCVGWLMFRETEMQQLLADFQLSPAASTALDRDAGLYLCGLTLLYSLPLWIHDVCEEFVRLEVSAPVAQAVACGVMFAVILVMRSQTALNFIYFAF